MDQRPPFAVQEPVRWVRWRQAWDGSRWDALGEKKLATRARLGFLVPVRGQMGEVPRKFSFQTNLISLGSTLLVLLADKASSLAWQLVVFLFEPSLHIAAQRLSEKADMSRGILVDFGV